LLVSITNNDFDTMGFRPTGSRPSEQARADARDALPRLQAALAPASNAQLLSEISRLRLRTKSRGQVDRDQEAMIADLVFALRGDPTDIELGVVPGDVALGALREWGRVSVWWPAWAELRALCLPETLRRRSLRDAVARIAGGDYAQASPGAPVSDPAERQRVAAGLGELARDIRRRLAVTPSTPPRAAHLRDGPGPSQPAEPIVPPAEDGGHES
jgi:hypothetical protein